MQLWLIRHGETDWNTEGRVQGAVDIALNARGIAQAHHLAARLAGESFDALYTSPLARARTTAEIIAQKLGHPPVSDARLEEKHLGELEGLTIQEFEKQFPEMYHAWHHRQEPLNLPRGETQTQFHERVCAFLDDAHARHSDASRLAIVSHGGTLGLMLATLVRLDVQRRTPFWLDNASLSLVEWRVERAIVRLLNDTCHLRDGHAGNGE
ncbi:MAG: histidine phosphatase family protein [Chloroflexi bacterium]|nr:histidine phosphatase family protein [Chloroflexota bacterium]